MMVFLFTFVCSLLAGAGLVLFLRTYSKSLSKSLIAGYVFVFFAFIFLTYQTSSFLSYAVKMKRLQRLHDNVTELILIEGGKLDDQN
jgi:hypothetical protein